MARAPTPLRLSKVVDEIVAAGGEAVANHDDVTSWNGAKRLVDTAVEAFGDLHVLVNNAGILRDRMLANMSEEEWDAVVHVHLKGHFCPLRHVAAYWREQAKAGHQAPRSVVNTSSTSGLFGNAGQANYGAAKMGIGALTIIPPVPAVGDHRQHRADGRWTVEALERAASGLADVPFELGNPMGD